MIKRETALRTRRKHAGHALSFITELFATSLLCLALLAGCAGSDEAATPSDDGATQTGQAAPTQNQEATQEQEQNSASETSALPDVPAYSGQPSVRIGTGEPSFTDEELAAAPGTETYGRLDRLGRCTAAFAIAGEETMPTGERGEISEVTPSGWVQNLELKDLDHLYERSHLIAWQLAGEDANERNLITGTAYMNQEGMKPLEDEIARYIEQTGNHVALRVTPYFYNDDLVCRGVQMEAWSLEDDGAGICMNEWCYNVQPGVEINYATGESQADATASTGNAQDAAEAQTSNGNSSGSDTHENAGVETHYVLNTRSMKFHSPSCPSVDEMSDANKAEVEATREELIAEGYSPCGECQP